MTAHVGDWRGAGACLDADPDLFFPITFTGLGVDQVALARKVCGRCPVRRQCLDYALGTRQTHGIWAGTTPDERRALLRRKTMAERQLARVS